MTIQPDHNQHGQIFEDPVYKEKPTVEVSADKMQAILHIPSDPLYVDVFGLLAEAGVFAGADKNVISEVSAKLLRGDKLEKSYVVATGIKPVNGQNGELIMRTNKPADVILSSEDISSVDYRVYKQKQLALASKDSPVAMIINPTKGHNGMNVLGEPVSAQDGDEVDLDLGANVKREGNKLIALIDGLIEYSKNDSKIKFDISEVYLIKEDVDFSTGNIDFPGSVIVKGSIKAGFEVKAKNEVVASTIRGKVVSGGGVTAKQGIIGGQGQAEIIAEGSVYAKFVHKAKIITGDSVYVKKSIMNSEIYAENQVAVENLPGSIIGGRTYAVNGIYAKIYGSEAYVKTEVAIFTSVRGIIDLKNIMAERFEMSKTLIKLENYLGNNKDLLMRQGEAKRIMVDKLLRKREEFRKELVKKDNYIKEIQNHLVEKNDSRITIGKKAMPEVKFMIGGRFVLLKDSVSRGSYFFSQETNEVEFIPGL